MDVSICIIELIHYPVREQRQHFKNKHRETLNSLCYTKPTRLSFLFANHKCKHAHTPTVLIILFHYSWNGGENHLIWNMIPGSPSDYSTVVDLALGNALIAGAGFDTWTYRVGFDISLPIYSPFAPMSDQKKSSNSIR